jgi:hypothetical protein
LVKAVSRTKHQSMDAGPNRILVPIDRGVVDREYCHSDKLEITHSGMKQGARTTKI